MAYAAPKIQRIFSFEDEPQFSTDDLFKAAKEGVIPSLTGRRKTSWTWDQLPFIGQTFGFLKNPDKPVVITSFVTKGGVLKSSLVLNLSRMAALHNIKTCVVGLDMQGDITAALGCSPDLEASEDLETALEKISEVRGLPEVFFNDEDPMDLIRPTNIPSLFLIPETPELVAMEQSLTLKNRREYWLKDHVIEPLKKNFDLIILDASPNWNQLITNALVSTDVLISPLECKINNFRNLKMFESFIHSFKKDLQLNFEHLYVPTRFSPHRKLSQEIFQWYQENLIGCSKNAIKESVQGEEASALNLSVPEYSPSSERALEINQLLNEIWQLNSFKSTQIKSSSIMEHHHGPIA